DATPGGTGGAQDTATGRADALVQQVTQPLSTSHVEGHALRVLGEVQLELVGGAGLVGEAVAVDGDVPVVGGGDGAGVGLATGEGVRVIDGAAGEDVPGGGWCGSLHLGDSFLRPSALLRSE